MTPFLDAAFIQRDDRVRVFDSEEEVLCLHNMGRNPAKITRMFLSRMFFGENALKEVWRYGEKMSYCGIGHACFM